MCIIRFSVYNVKLHTHKMCYWIENTLWVFLPFTTQAWVIARMNLDIVFLYGSDNKFNFTYWYHHKLFSILLWTGIRLVYKFCWNLSEKLLLGLQVFKYLKKISCSLSIDVKKNSPVDYSRSLTRKRFKGMLFSRTLSRTNACLIWLT